MTVLTARTLTAADDDTPHPEDFLTRDRWGRPEINPPGGGPKRGYRRASSFGSPLESDFALQLWGKRQVAMGVAKTDHLAIAITRGETRLRDAEAGLIEAKRAGGRGLKKAAAEAKAAKQELDDLCEAAMKAVGSDAAAEIGTALHHICERIDLGLDPGHIPTVLLDDVRAYIALTRPRFRMVSVERFVVQDELEVGGTLDRAAELLVPMTPTDDHGNPIGDEIPAGTVLIDDIKTAQDMFFAAAKFGVQNWCYSSGTPYNTKTGMREPWGHPAPSLEWALITHLPSKQGKASLYWVNLTDAKEAAEEACTVYEWRNKRGKKLITKAVVVEIEEDFFDLAANAESVEVLVELSRRASAAGKWNDVLRQAFTRRKNELIESVPSEDTADAAVGAE
jgi:hypothetical protein